jgi:hypothetical protein
VLSVTIEHNDGRYKASAKLFLEIPELLDEWPESRQNAFVKNKEVSFQDFVMLNHFSTFEYYE